MISHGEITLTFGDDDYTFNIAKLGQRFELEDKAGRGTQSILRRIIEGEETFREIRETIRIGLIGGGQTPEAALKLVRTYVDERPRKESALIAQAILMVEIAGMPDDPVGKTEADRAKKKATRSSEKTVASSVPLS